MIITADHIAAAGRAAAARGLPGIPPEIIRAMLDAVINPPEADELPPMPEGVVTIQGIKGEEPAEIEVASGSEQDEKLRIAMREVTTTRRNKRKVRFYRAILRTEDQLTATYTLERTA